MLNDETSSVLISRTLDHLGYGLPMVQFRQIFIDHSCQREFYKGYTFFAGSKAEGITKLYESDADMLTAKLNVISTTNPQSVPSSEYLSIFKLDTEYTAPGYTRLILVKFGNPMPYIVLDSLCEPVSGKIYLSSYSWRLEMKKNAQPYVDRHSMFMSPLPCQGPSTPLHQDFFSCDYDVVLGMICDYPKLLESWINRPRKYNWPHSDVVREIATMEAHVVPIGYKESPFQSLEWRICFTKAEIKLVQSFNDCQIKLLILLKWLAKNCLKPICKDITTYVMKNLVMWMAEKLPDNYFTEKNLVHTLSISITTLKSCVMKRYLQNYMIPDRNLFADRITDRERSRLCLRMNSLLREGPQIVLRCGKIRNAFNMILRSPESFFSFTQRQFRVNISFMLIWCATRSYQKGDITKQELIKRFSELAVILYYSLIPDRNELNVHVENKGKFIKDRLVKFLS